MIKLSQSQNEKLKFLRENLSILIIVPAFLGGIWQLFELMAISFPLIRFFSISQIVPDGLLILGFLLFALISPLMGFLTTLEIFGGKAPEDNDNTAKSTLTISQSNRKYVTIVLSFLCICILSLNFIWEKYFATTTVENLGFVILLAFGTILICYKLLNSLSDILHLKNRLSIRLCKLILFIYILIITYIVSCQMHDLFLLNDNLMNVEYVKSDLEKNYPKAKKEILYYNDKYIFIRITDNQENENNSKIKVGKSKKIKSKKETENKGKILIMEINKIFDVQEK
ncbi:hypothetical protein Q1W71_01090 [Flavobacterium pectinovorum]|uniref:hypothetical protein n=1 Tax=Flavobacterium pectinovorum TaxID=29533 RepID=UPI00265D760A|nr:hypothetical protein [Flavobacterium pectinovorum]WKL48377.1 hypothetical protein Q1W71_01090 [Flavobacterium pectinovorum]